MDNIVDGEKTGKSQNNQSFKTPEQVSAADNQTVISPLLNNPTEQGVESKDKMPKKKRKFWPPSKFGWIVIVLVLILIGVCIYAYTLIDKPKPKPVVITVHKAVITTVPSTLTGLPVSPATNQLPITAVMVENIVDARPQS